MCSEAFLILLWKAIRNDFWYWEKASDECEDVNNSIVTIPLTGCMVAFTGCAGLRMPIELGRALYTFILGSTMSIGLVSAVLYEEDGAGDRMDKGTAFLIMATACAGMLVSCSTLLYSVDRKFVGTFFSTMTGNQQIQEVFTESSEDKYKIKVFKHNQPKWKAYIGDEVKAWLNSCLPVWLKEEPDWLTVGVKSTIPDELVDDKAMLSTLNNAAVVQKKEENRRLSSVSMRMSGRG